MAFPVLAIMFICYCAPTIILMLIPLIACRQRIPLTSTIANLLTNCCFSGLTYGIYMMIHEKEFDFDQAEIISIGCFVGIIAVFLVFFFRLFNFAWCSEKDSIAYVPAHARNSFFDVYTLLEMLMKLRARPPMIFVRGVASHRDEEDSDDEVVTWSSETPVPYGSWRDITDSIRITKAWMLDITCEIEYEATAQVRAEIAQKRSEVIDQNVSRDDRVVADVEFVTPGYSRHYLATTRGTTPGFVKFMRSSGGKAFRVFLLLIGYHSLLECIWMMMLQRQTIVFRKEISHEEAADDDWVGEGEVHWLDYHNVPYVA